MTGVLTPFAGAALTAAGAYRLKRGRPPGRHYGDRDQHATPGTAGITAAPAVVSLDAAINGAGAVNVFRITSRLQTRIPRRRPPDSEPRSQKRRRPRAVVQGVDPYDAARQQLQAPVHLRARLPAHRLAAADCSKPGAAQADGDTGSGRRVLRPRGGRPRCWPNLLAREALPSGCPALQGTPPWTARGRIGRFVRSRPERYGCMRGARE